MANTENNIKKGQYLKKTGPDSYVHYHFDTDDSVVYLSAKIDGANESGEAYAKDAKLHDALCALYTLASQGGQAAIDLAELATLVNDHLSNANNPHNVKPAQIGLGNVVNAPMDAKPTENSNNYVKSGGVYTAVKNVDDKVEQVRAIANGQSHAYVFADVAGLKSGTLSNNQPISGYKVGDSIYIIAPDVSDFWISGGSSNGAASNDNVINHAKKGDTVIVKWGSSYVSLTALESKRDLNDYATTSALKSALKNIYDKTTIEENYVPYSGAKYDVNLGDRVLSITDGILINGTSTVISKGQIALSGTVIEGSGVLGRTVDITANGISVGNTRFYYPDDTIPGVLATQRFVTGRGYQTVSGVKSVIGTAIGATTGDVTFSGSVDNGITATLSNTNITPGTYSALTVDAKGRATKGWQQIRFASTIDDPILNDLVIDGVAIIDAQ